MPQGGADKYLSIIVVSEYLAWVATRCAKLLTPHLEHHVSVMDTAITLQGLAIISTRTACSCLFRQGLAAFYHVFVFLRMQ